MTDNFDTRYETKASSFNTLYKLLHDQENSDDDVMVERNEEISLMRERMFREAETDRESFVSQDEFISRFTQDAGKSKPEEWHVKSKAGGITEQCWHESCLRCSVCHQTMTERCYEREGRFYCSEDYYRLFGAKCSICNDPIARMELVMRATHTHYCHVSCFKCVTCHRPLGTGDLYSVNAEHGLPYCQYHTMDAYAQSQHNQLSNISNGQADNHDMATAMIGGNMSYLSDDYPDGDLHGNSKLDKRSRTVLSSTQRMVLMAAFNRDPKPSKKARHVLAVDTGLSNRVVQVWFQNQRAKTKKRSKPSSSSTVDESDSEPSQQKSSSASSSSNMDSISPHPEFNDYGAADKNEYPSTDEEMLNRVNDMHCSEDDDRAGDFQQMVLPSNDSYHPHAASKLIEMNSPSLYPQYCF